MKESLLAFLPLMAQFSLFAFALYCLHRQKSVKKQLIVPVGLVSIVGLTIAVASLIFISATTEIYSPLLGLAGLGFSIRLDMLSAIMLVMIALLGFVIMRFSINYMDGDPRKNVFIGRLAVTIASVQLLILSNNLFQLLLFWVVTSICLHYLLVFYRHRPQAIVAARKKFILARLGDISLFAAVLFLYGNFNTGDFTEIFEAIKSGNYQVASLTIATVLLVMAALFKSAQFPTHGWLIEVVETPTPVSALLHAGLLNAGPFLMVRFSYLLAEATSASVLLIIVGGFTALLASIIYLTQSSIKVSLGYSSIAHMGFSLLLSGLGLYAAAILHIVAHSFYKAHAFLSSGSMVDSVRAQSIKLPKRLGHPLRIFSGFILATVVFLGASFLWGLNFANNFGLLFVGAVITMGLSQFLVQIMDIKINAIVFLQIIFISCFVAFSFLGLEHLASNLLSGQIPAFRAPNSTVQIAASILMLSFALAIFLQLMAPGLKPTKFMYQWGIHLRNGLYANVLFDRFIGSLKPEKFKWANLAVKEEIEAMPNKLGQEKKILLEHSKTLIN